MKRINNIKIILFSLVIFGCFANFAQNDYGFQIIKLCLVGLAVTYFVEAIISKRKLKSNFLMWEALAISVFLDGFIFKMMHWPGGGVMLIISGGVLSLIYLTRGIKSFRKERGSGLALSFLVLMVYLSVAIAFAGWVFNIQHYPGADLLGQMTLFMFPALFVAMFFKFKHGKKTVRFAGYMQSRAGNIRLMFIVFSVIVGYFIMRSADVVPHFYSLSMPPKMEELSVKGATGTDERAEKRWRKYKKGYYDFLYNRGKAESE